MLTPPQLMLSCLTDPVERDIIQLPAQCCPGFKKRGADLEKKVLRFAWLICQRCGSRYEAWLADERKAGRR
ncbi:MAG TPA: hypothetical protein VHO25_24065 [Polyangiaceae bacterium]|nr:hypothetical protein [Polyangiaceae bacterium]